MRDFILTETELLVSYKSLTRLLRKAMPVAHTNEVRGKDSAAKYVEKIDPKWDAEISLVWCSGATCSRPPSVPQLFEDFAKANFDIAFELDKINDTLSTEYENLGVGELTKNAMHFDLNDENGDDLPVRLELRLRKRSLEGASKTRQESPTWH